MEIIQLLFIKYGICTFEKNTLIWSTLLLPINTLISPDEVYFIHSRIRSSLSIHPMHQSYWAKSQNIQEKFWLSYSKGLDSGTDIACALLVSFTSQWKTSATLSCPVTSAAAQNPYGFAYTGINITNSCWLDATAQEAVHCRPCSASVQVQQFGSHWKHFCHHFSAEIKAVFSGNIFHSISASFFLEKAYLRIDCSIVKDCRSNAQS